MLPSRRLWRGHTESTSASTARARLALCARPVHEDHADGACGSLSPPRSLRRSARPSLARRRRHQGPPGREVTRLRGSRARTCRTVTRISAVSHFAASAACDRSDRGVGSPISIHDAQQVIQQQQVVIAALRHGGALGPGHAAARSSIRMLRAGALRSHGMRSHRCATRIYLASTSTLRRLASTAASRTTRLFPIPGGPLKLMTHPLPSRASSSTGATGCSGDQAARRNRIAGAP
jgi:hypothetical protein